MSGNNALQVVPTRLTLQTLKQRLAAANRGHILLKNKASALTLRIRTILNKIAEKKVKMADYIRDAYISFVAAKIASNESNFVDVVLEDVTTATYKLRVSSENIVGVKLPMFEPWVISGQSKQYAGLCQGGGKIKTCSEIYEKVLESLVEIASLQTSFVVLDQVIKSTNRRVNAIEQIFIPRITKTISFVETELEELEREEMFRLKKIQKKKNADSSNVTDTGEDASVQFQQSLLSYAPNEEDVVF